MRRLLAMLIALLFVSASAVSADEGMWTFDNFPSAKVAQTYGFTPSAQLLAHIRSSSVRLTVGCSGSFISPQGLVMTNHHCVVGCVGHLSTAQQNYVNAGFYAKRQEDERTCPDFEIDQLTGIENVTAVIHAAIANKTGDAAQRALRAAEATAQETCGKSTAIRCDVVSLYHGGIYDLYHYKRFTDVRLVFAPEYDVAQFGGDPDNFNFPRYDFDIGVVRAYENGKPAGTPDFLKWSASGTKAGDLVFVSGNPGGTSRELTVAELTEVRDVQFPRDVPDIAEERGILEEFGRRSPEAAREVREHQQGIENYYKVTIGRQEALDNPAFFGAKVQQEQALRAAVAKNAALETADGSAWDDIAKLQTLKSDLDLRYEPLARLGYDGLFSYAQTLVEAAAERRKPNPERLSEYTDQALVGVAQELNAPVPIYPDYEEVELGFRLSLLRRDLGTDDPLVKAFLGTESPEALAHRLVSGTQLGDPAVRKRLFDGGQAAIDASTDPLIVYAKRVDPNMRAIRTSYEARVEAPTRTAAQRIADARFAIYGTSVDPDATFTARLSYGAVKGFEANGVPVAPYTTINGLFNRATGSPPYVLPSSWLTAKPALNLATPMNLSTSNDVIGGNSGSPLINTRGEVVGLIFDGNIYSLSGDFGYDATQNRSISVDSRALLEGLSRVYHADRLVTEIQSARNH